MKKGKNEEKHPNIETTYNKIQKNKIEYKHIYFFKPKFIHIPTYG